MFSLALTATALLIEICRNRRFSTGMGHFERNFLGKWGRRPQSIYVATTLPLEVFTQRNFVADFIR